LKRLRGKAGLNEINYFFLPSPVAPPLQVLWIFKKSVCLNYDQAALLSRSHFIKVRDTIKKAERASRKCYIPNCWLANTTVGFKGRLKQIQELIWDF
jgi:hypothetical protein